MSGTISFSNNPSTVINAVNDTANNYRYLQIQSGDWREGSALELNMNGDYNQSSSAVLWGGGQAYRFDNTGDLYCADLWRINKWGETFSGLSANQNVVISNGSDGGNGGCIGLNSSYSYTTGAYCRFFSSSWSGDTLGAGRFNLCAVGLSTNSTLVGKPDGTLIWDGKHVARFSRHSSTSGGWIINEFHNGFIILETYVRISSVAAASGTNITVTLPYALNYNSYGVYTTKAASGSYWSNCDESITSQTTTSFNLYIWNNGGVAAGPMGYYVLVVLNND